MKKIVIALMLLVMVGSFASAAPLVYNKTVAATAANTPVTFGFGPQKLLVANTAGSTAYYRLDGVAVAGGANQYSVAIPACTAREMIFPSGQSPALIGVISDATSTVVVSAVSFPVSGATPESYNYDAFLKSIPSSCSNFTFSTLVATTSGTFGGAAGALNTVTIDTSGLTFEGSTPDGNETTVGVIDPTADATFNFPALGAAGSPYLICPVQTAGLTATRIPFADANKALTDDGDLTFTGGDTLSAKKIVEPNLYLTAGTATETAKGSLNAGWHAYSWTNAMVAALPGQSGEITMFTLPAKTFVEDAYLVIDTAATVLTTMTVSCGRAGAAYVDYIVASDGKAVANTIYGNAVGERGANLTGYDLVSMTATTDVKCQFKATTGAETLATVLTSTGTLYVKTNLLP